MAKNGNVESVGNFKVSVLSLIEVITDSEKTLCVRFKLIFNDGTTSDEITVPLTGPKGLDKINWYDLHPRVTLDIKLNNARQILTNLIRKQLPSVPQKTQYHIKRLGTHIIDDEPIFNTGGGLIRPSPNSTNNIDIFLNSSKYKSDTDTNLSDFGKLNWDNFKSDTPRQNFMDFTRYDLTHVQKKNQYRFNSLGEDVINCNPTFTVEWGLLPHTDDQSSPDIIPGPQKCKIDFDPNLSEREAVAGMMAVVNLIPNAGRIILAQMLLYLMRKVYEDVWKSPRVCIFLWGKTGTKKSTMSAYLTQLYDRSKGIMSLPRLNSSIPAAVNIIYQKSDCVVVLDDLFPADSNKIKNQQEETLFEITRIIGDGIQPGRMKGNKLTLDPATNGVLFIGEYLIGTGSDAARLLPVLMTPPDGEKLKPFQDQPLLVSTFYYGFIKWFIENYYKIQNSLKKWSQRYTNTNLGVHDRLKETHFFLNTAYSLFLQYCLDRGFTTTDKAKAQRQSFEDLLTDLVREQDKRVKQSKNSKVEKVDSYKLIRALNKSDSFCLAKNIKRYNYEPDKYDGLIHNELLCLRSENLLQKFQSMGYSNTLGDIRSSLIANNAIKLDSEGKNYKIGKSRFYGIYLNKLR
jgi:hypothetical protein